MLLPLFAVIVIGLAWSAYWWIAIGIARDRLSDERTRLAREGLELACVTERWGGYPFRFEFECQSPVITVGPRISVATGNILAVALAYKPSHLLALVDGPTTVAGPDHPDLHFTHGRVLASFKVRSGEDVTVSVEVPKLASDRVGSWSNAVAHARTGQNGAVDVALSIDDLHIATAASADLIIDNSALTGRIDASRTVEIDKVDLRRQKTAVWGKGNVTLDPSRRPQGKIATETNDLKGLLDILEPHLKMSDQERANLRMLMGLFGQTAKLDLVANDGALMVGPLKVADLKPLY